jgi:hypothetical protein
MDEARCDAILRAMEVFRKAHPRWKTSPVPGSRPGEVTLVLEDASDPASPATHVAFRIYGEKPLPAEERPSGPENAKNSPPSITLTLDAGFEAWPRLLLAPATVALDSGFEAFPASLGEALVHSGAIPWEWAIESYHPDFLFLSGTGLVNAVEDVTRNDYLALERALAGRLEAVGRTEGLRKALLYGLGLLGLWSPGDVGGVACEAVLAWMETRAEELEALVSDSADRVLGMQCAFRFWTTLLGLSSECRNWEGQGITGALAADANLRDGRFMGQVLRDPARPGLSEILLALERNPETSEDMKDQLRLLLAGAGLPPDCASIRAAALADRAVRSSGDDPGPEPVL